MKSFINLLLAFTLMLTFNAFASSSTGWSSHSKILADVSLQTGTDIELLATVGALESSFNNRAKAEASSATGLFQFTSRTWRVTVKRYGKEYGVASNAVRTDALANTLMAAAYLKENADILRQRLGREATMTEVYLAHMLAPRRVVQLVNAPRWYSAAKLFPAAARANRNLFYTKEGKSRSVASFFELVNVKVKSKHFAYRDLANEAYDLHLTEVREIETVQLAAMFKTNDCHANELVRKYGNVIDIPVDELIGELDTVDYTSHASNIEQPNGGPSLTFALGAAVERREFV